MQTAICTWYGRCLVTCFGRGFERHLPHMLGRRISGWILLAALTGWGGAARAQPGSSDRDVQTASLMSERLRLRMELDRTNAEIDALKRENRGLRDDYRLRSRMADAEALARRLTDLEARLPRTSSRSAGSRQSDAATSWPNAPEAAPSDDRGVLEAKADILSDQARRLNGQADLLAARVTELQARNELRRRAGQLERDPFSPLEQARRRLTTTGTSGRSELPTSNGAAPERPASSPGTTRAGRPISRPPVGRPSWARGAALPRRPRRSRRRQEGRLRRRSPPSRRPHQQLQARWALERRRPSRRRPARVLQRRPLPGTRASRPC